MRNLWIFFGRNYAFFLFLFLEIIAFIFIANNNNFQKASLLNSSNYISGNFYDLTSDFKNYLNLKEINEELIAENTRLRNSHLSSIQDNLEKSIPDLVVDSLRKYQFTYLSAHVNNNSIIYRNNYLTLNKGWKDGIQKNMGVISADGLVGIVKDVSQHFCTVVSLLHKDTRISAMVKSTQEFGSLTWDGEDPKFAQLTDIPTHVMLHRGDEIVSSGYSTIFPGGIPIGSIEKIELKEGENFFNISVKLSPDFSRLKNVYIITNRLRLEKIGLENKLPKE